VLKPTHLGEVGATRPPLLDSLTHLSGEVLMPPLHPMLHTSTEEACEDKKFCCSVIDGKLQLKHAHAATKKKVTFTRLKEILM